MSASRVVCDTNVFVAAGFDRTSASARILAEVREGRLTLVWDHPTRRETERIIRKIPPLRWNEVADLFREDGKHEGPTHPARYDWVEDPDDRKYAALADAAGATLLSNDDHLLKGRDRAGFSILTPSEFARRANLPSQQ